MDTLRRTLVVAALAGNVALAGCGGDADSSRGPAPTATDGVSESASVERSPEQQGPSAAATIRVLIQGDSVTPVAEQVEIGVGDTVEVLVRSDRAGELHVHSTPERVVALRRGRSVVPVRLERPGSVDIEEHHSGVLVARVLVR